MKKKPIRRAERWFFDDPKNVAKLQRVAAKWIGETWTTPFRQYSRAPGPAGGVDCIALDEGIMHGVGAAPKFKLPRTSADYQGHAHGDKVLRWLRGKDRDPQSKKLAAIFAEIKLPRRLDLSEAHLPPGFLMPGDLLVMIRFQLFHMPIVIDTEHHFISAIPRLGVVRGTVQDSSYREHLKAVFRARA
jgi:hypothetical protein